MESNSASPLAQAKSLWRAGHRQVLDMRTTMPVRSAGPAGSLSCAQSVDFMVSKCKRAHEIVPPDIDLAKAGSFPRFI